MIKKRISYRPLWHILINRQLPKIYLVNNDTNWHITTASLARLSQDKYVSLDVLMRICCILQVDLHDICETVTYSDELYNDLEQNLK